jgi:DNA-binding IclR family transcriptional regulator
MGRRSDFLTGKVLTSPSKRPEIIDVVSRAFCVLRCFEPSTVRLGNREIADRCGIPRSTVSRLTRTLTSIGELTYLVKEQKYCLATRAFSGELGSYAAADESNEAHKIMAETVQ